MYNFRSTAREPFIANDGETALTEAECELKTSFLGEYSLSIVFIVVHHHHMIITISNINTKSKNIVAIAVVVAVKVALLSPVALFRLQLLSIFLLVTVAAFSHCIAFVLVTLITV